MFAPVRTIIEDKQTMANGREREREARCLVQSVSCLPCALCDRSGLTRSMPREMSVLRVVADLTEKDLKDLGLNMKARKVKGSARGHPFGEALR